MPGGRAITHLVIESEGFVGSGDTAEGVGYAMCEGSDSAVGGINGRSDSVVIGKLGQSASHIINTMNPNCYSAFRRERVISARFSWSPMSSDCAFIPMGCSVSSRYTFP